LSSDHKPLDAVFTLEYDAIVPELKSKIQHEVARELDRAENEGRPGITVVVDSSLDSPPIGGPSDRKASSSSAEGVDFGHVAFLERKSRSLTIANTSAVHTTFAFVDKPSVSGDDRIAPSWLSVYFVGSAKDEDERAKNDLKREVTLEPGDAVNVTLELFVDDISLVTELNQGKAQLDDVLVLRVTDGRDHFIPVRGTWQQSCLGRSIDELIRVPEGGVRALRPPRHGSGGPVNRGREVCWSAPRELFKLTEAVELLTDRVIADSNMLDNAHLPLEAPGWPFSLHSWTLQDKSARDTRKRFVLEALDSDKTLTDSFPPKLPSRDKLEIMAEVLLLFLGSLTDGIITESLWTSLEHDIVARGPKQLTDPEEIKTWVLDVLSAAPNHNISFVFLTSMLCRVASELAPVPKFSWKEQVAGSARSSIETMRRSLSWKGKAPPLPSDPGVMRRQAVEKAYAEVFTGVIFRGPGSPVKEKERRVVEDRRRDILEAFLEGGRDVA
jgi:inositol polyphosphate 5-phosphatase INPP5B/F